MKLNQITPLPDTKKLYQDLLADYKTTASKKAFMTRSMKSHVSFLKDVTEAVTRTHHRGWLHGEFFTTYHVLHYAKELKLLQDIKESIV